MPKNEVQICFVVGELISQQLTSSNFVESFIKGNLEGDSGSLLKLKMKRLFHFGAIWMLLYASRVMASNDSHACNNSKLKNIDYLGTGYDVISGNPHSSHDPGTRKLYLIHFKRLSWVAVSLPCLQVKRMEHALKDFSLKVKFRRNQNSSKVFGFSNYWQLLPKY